MQFFLENEFLQKLKFLKLKFVEGERDKILASELVLTCVERVGLVTSPRIRIPPSSTFLEDFHT